MALNQVVTQSEQTAVAPSQSDNLLTQIVAAASNPEVDADKMEKMANLALRLREDEQRQQFNRDLAAAMMEMPRISKRNTIVIPANRQKGTPEREQGKFASWENIDAVIRPILERHRLALRFKLRGDTDGTYCRPILVHTNGYVDEGEELRVPPDTSGSKNAAQAIGSSSSYAKRYAACAALNIVTEGEDRDGTQYPLADDAMNDRQIRIIAEARQAHQDGNFQAWWERQLPSDRQWLIIKGVYADLTGAPQIAGPRTLPVQDEGPEITDDRQGDNSTPKPEPGTRDQMVDRYLAKIESCMNSDSVLAITEDQATIKWLRKLQEQNPTEYDRATMGASAHFGKLIAEEEAADRGGQGDLLD